MRQKKRRKKRKPARKSSKESSLHDWFGRKGAKGKKKAGLTATLAEKTKRPEKRLVKPVVGRRAKSVLNIPLVGPLLGPVGRGVRANLGARSQKERKPMKQPATMYMV